MVDVDVNRLGNYKSLRMKSNTKKAKKYECAGLRVIPLLCAQPGWLFFICGGGVLILICPQFKSGNMWVTAVQSIILCGVRFW